jgi:hypothetical protein
MWWPIGITCQALATIGQKQLQTTNPAVAQWSNQLTASLRIKGLGPGSFKSEAF